MRFAKICFSKNDEMAIKPSLLPKAIRRRYYLMFKKPEKRDISIFSAEGLKFIIPFKKDEEDFELVNEYIKKMCRKIQKEGFAAVSSPDISLDMYERKTSGRIFNCMCLKKILEKAAQLKNMPVEELNVVVKDGGGEAVKTAVYALSKECSKLWICTNDSKRLRPVCESIFADTGLCIGAFSVPNGSIMREADVIINLENGGEFYNCFAKNSVYVDIADDRRNTDKICRSRGDMYVLRGFAAVAKGKRGVILPEDAEAAFCALSGEFYSMVFKGFSQEEFDGSSRLVERFNFKIKCTVYHDGKQVKS